MAEKTHPQRSPGTLIGIALLGFMSASAAPPSSAQGGQDAGDSSFGDGSFGEGVTELSSLVRAADDMRRWAWSPKLPGNAFPARVDALLAAAAGEPSAAVWQSAHAVDAIAEASLRLAGRDRLDLAMAARDLGRFAPSEPLRVDAVRAELRLLESVVLSSAVASQLGVSPGDRSHGQGGAADSPVLRARARLNEILDGLEFVEAGASVASTSPFRDRLEVRLQTLAVGQRIPRFLARDAAGNEVRSSLLAGRVTVLRLWESSSPASMLAHERDAHFARKFWDAPVALFGATQSLDRSEYLAELEARSFRGTQLFDGPISTALHDELAQAGDGLAHGAGWSAPVSVLEAWSGPAVGSLFVIDEDGVIRGRDLLGDELDSLVSQLVAERRARLRVASQGRFTTSPSR